MDERRIFEYEAAGVQRRGDPVALRRRFTLEMGCDPNTAAADWYGGDPLAAAHAEERLVAAGRAVFGLPPWDEASDAGVLDGEVVALVDKFFWFESEQKKSTASTPTSPGSTAPPPCPSPTTSDTDSGSMPNESDFSEPSPLSAE